MNMKPCEVCGQPATEAVADVCEVEPDLGELDGKPVLYARHEIHSTHAFCEAHRRPGLERDRQGKWRIVEPTT